jgi:Wiskott-Aldrich syndrome protein
MPTSLTLSPDDKEKVKRAVPKNSNKIITATVSRIYECREGSESWSYTGQEGALVLSADKAKGALWFKMVDLTVSAPLSSA